LQFTVNADGRVAGVPRDAFWKSGSGGHCLYVVPSLDLVVWKLGGRDEQYDARQTGLEPVYSYDGSREGWKPPAAARDGVEKTLQMAVAAAGRRPDR
jgi:CubicO group peptidase (beta-lactamase class C family)